MYIPRLHPLVIVFVLMLVVISGAALLHKPNTTPGETLSWGGDAQPPTNLVGAANTVPTNPISDATIIASLPAFSYSATSSNAITALHTYFSSNNRQVTTTQPNVPSDSIFDLITKLSSATYYQPPAVNIESSALHTYGNAAGSIIQTFDTQQMNANTTFDAFFKEPNDTTAAGLLALVPSYLQTASALAALSSVPIDAQSKNQALANAYESLGHAIETLAHVRSSDALITAVNEYNPHVEELGSAYVDLVQLFIDNSTTFTPSEAGYVFMYTGTQ